MSPEQRKKKAAEIWQTLSAIDVSPYVQKRQRLDYLPWERAWSLLMDHYPQAVLAFERFDGRDVMTYVDGTCAVFCSIEIDGVTREMSLPVMDNKHRAIKGGEGRGPDSREVSDARQRGWVTCLAMHGLGHSVFCGDGLPSAGPAAPEAAPLARPRPSAPQGPSSPETQALQARIEAHQTQHDLYEDDDARHAIQRAPRVVHDYLMSVWTGHEEVLQHRAQNEGLRVIARPDFSARDNAAVVGRVQDTAAQ